MKVPTDLTGQWAVEWIDYVKTNFGNPNHPECESSVDFIAERAADWATSQERERCAKLCEVMPRVTVAEGNILTDAAKAIRLPNGDSND